MSPGTFFLCSFILLARVVNWLTVGYFLVVIVGLHLLEFIGRDVFSVYTPFLGMISSELDTRTKEETLTHLV